MNRSELNEKAKKYLDNAGVGTGTNITLHGAKCLMVDFYLDNQVKNNVGLGNVSNTEGKVCITCKKTLTYSEAEGGNCCDVCWLST